MENSVNDFYRIQIKEGLAILEERHRMLFKRMYSHSNLEKPINDVVDDMPEANLDNALDQVNRTIKKKWESPTKNKDSK